MNRRESGYSLVEILVVVAMIGIISLVTVPNFIAMQRSSKLKSSMRNFVGDVRGMRQRAVTKHHQTKISFVTGTAITGRNYTIAEFDPVSSTWQQIGPAKRLDEACYVVSQTNLTDVDGDGTIDLVFKPDGAPVLPPNIFEATTVLKTDWNLPTSQYTVTITFSGAVKTS
ncbi:MAG TPA: prepilin-type N-terminal cleavage/methylation domain-containing protein [Thermoanaerobaculia bacterium]|nr:prepilin-type N-terminal cleavage/methylation domain-containing protein [Thermoanaerobaculia bacterium]